MRRPRMRRPGRGLLMLLGGAGLVLLAAPAAHADVWANVGPASSLAGLASRYPLGSYALDEHFTAISAGVFSGVDVSGLLPMIAYFFANELWQLTAWLANLLVELFSFAFSLDLVNGSAATGGAGALGPVSRAISSIYSGVFGGPWMVLAVSVSGCWAMWKALVQRRYAETAGQLGLSLLYVGIAFLFVLRPAQTIGEASHWTNAMSGAFLSIAKDGEPSSQGEAREAGANQLFGLLVADPWSVLEFGGLDHCVKAGGGEEPESVAVQPLPGGAARRLESGEEVTAEGKTCVENLRRYGPHFLRFAPGSKEREEEFEALSEGDSSKLPEADPGKGNGTYELGPADRPAASAMEKGGQYQRLLVAIVVFAFELGAFFLLGALALGVITAQVLLLLLLAFSPVALVAAAIPGRGHQFFRGWLAKLAGFLLRKTAYSLVLAILLAVCAAISAAASELGWLFSFGLQCAFFWAVFLQRRSLTEGLVGAVAGPGSPGGERALKVLALYSGARLGARSVSRPARTVGSRLRRGRAGEGPGPVAAAASPQREPGGSDASLERPPDERRRAAEARGRGRNAAEDAADRAGPEEGAQPQTRTGGLTAGAGRGDGDGRPDVRRDGEVREGRLKDRPPAETAGEGERRAGGRPGGSATGKRLNDEDGARPAPTARPDDAPAGSEVSAGQERKARPTGRPVGRDARKAPGPPAPVRDGRSRAPRRDARSRPDDAAAPRGQSGQDGSVGHPRTPEDGRERS